MPGLLAYWSFDDVAGGAVTDHSPRKNQAALVGGRIADGVRGQALWLDDVPDHYCDFSASADFNFAANTEFTFAGWFTTSQVSATILSLRHSRGLSNPQVELLVRDGRAMVIVSDDQDQAGQNGVVWAKQRNDGQWHHFAFTRRGNTVELFLDGVSQGQHTAAGVGGPITTDLRAVGCERLWAQQNDRRWGDPSVRGGVDEVCIFGRALAPAEIQTLMAR
jgi:Concanavalin A-like lectin/glucanases superfamily